jgi:hypothetical protein
MNSLYSILDKHNIFTVFSVLLDKIKDEEYTLNDLAKFDKDFLELTKELSSIDMISRVKATRRQKRTWEKGAPIQMQFSIELSSLRLHEIDTYKSMCRGVYSDSVKASNMEAGYLQLGFNSGHSVVFYISFGVFGDSESPTVSLSTDVYNESWDDTHSSKDCFRVPDEVFNLVSRLSYECRMNSWSEFLRT